ncbi:hypothetical protein F5X68DRAFT_228942 [Plectosphaerella plurivora]|uniref:DUF7721 domain-containing protein n=1 Tax=Plectosphaerella plurivora TaxID=936078 RepID=A0A9P9AEA4_9PEZI|nr:hypothetical protein F5X68DRAFT_228942 [Plectosphaerella plurivora]
MDFLNKAKDFLEENNKPQQSQQQQQQQSSGEQILPPGNKAQGGAYTPFGGDDKDFGSAAGEASRLAGSSGDKDLFSSILGSLGKGSNSDRDVDEAAAVNSHQKFVAGQDGGEKADEQGLGAAAAVQALKLFNSQGSSGDNQKGADQTQGGFLALALAEASKLFDDKEREGKLQEGTTKQGVIREAGEVALKLFLKNQSGGAGGAGGLADIAGKFFK